MGLFGRRRTAPTPAPTQPAQPAHPALVVDPTLGDPAAAQLRAWLTRRDWPAARDLLSSVTDPDDRAFYLSIAADTPGVEQWIGQCVAAEPHSTLPLLVQGARAVYWAWDARGAKSADHTSQEQFREFFRRLRFAENCLDEVVERDPEDVTAWSFLVTSARGRQVDRAEAQRRFDEVVKRHPHHRMAHEQMLQYLCRKWFGSHEEMFAFARSVTAASPPGSLLGELVAIAHIERWLDLPSGDDAAYMSQPEVVAELHRAADHSIRSPYYRPRPGWPAVHNVFAFAFCLAGEWSAAADQFDVIGDRIHAWVWGYFDGNAVGTFQNFRADAYRYGRPAQPSA